MISREQAYEIGKTIGYFTVVGAFTIVMLTGILLNYFAARRSSTNPKCAWAAVWAFVGGLIFGVGNWTMQWAKLDPPLRSLPGLFALLALIIAVTLAVMGLGEMKRFHDHFRHGRKRAIIVLALPVLIALGVVAAVVAHSSGHPIFSSQIGGTAGETVTNKSWNFQLIAPPPWVSIDATKLNPAARAGLARQGPQMFSMVIAEDLSKAGGVQFDSVVTTVKARLKEEQQAEVIADEAQQEGGLPGRRIESFATADGNRLYYVRWLTYYGDTVYQVITWGSPLAADQVRVESRKLAAGFRIIDPKIAPIAEAERADPIFTSEKFGYAIDLKNTVWNRRWTTLAQELPMAEFGVLNARGSAAFCVIPVWIGDDDVDFEAVAAALAARVGVPFPDDSLFGIRNVHQGAVRGRAFAFERTQGDLRLLYRLRVLRGHGFAYLLASWMNKKSESASEFLDLAMDCVAFPDKVDREPLLTGERVRTTHALIWNDIGVALLRAGSASTAAPWFQRAFEIERSNLVPLANYADSLIQSGRAADALAAVDRYASEDQRLPLQRLRAQVMQANGKNEEAIRTLRELHKANPDDQDTTLILTDALLNGQRFADALAECDRLIAAGVDTAGVLQRKGLAEANLKRFRDAKATLEKALAKEPANAVIKRLLEQVVALSSTGSK